MVTLPVADYYLVWSNIYEIDSKLIPYLDRPTMFTAAISDITITDGQCTSKGKANFTIPEFLKCSFQSDMVPLNIGFDS